MSAQSIRSASAAALLALGTADLVVLNQWVFPRAFAGRFVDYPRSASSVSVARVPTPAPAAAELAIPAVPQVAQPLLAVGPPPPPVAPLPRVRRTYFALNQHALDPGARAAIDALAATAKNSHARVLVEGHADQSGPETFNGWLSQRRAEAVARRLIARGVPADRIDLRHYGSTRPAVVADGDSPTERRNRRVEIAFIEEVPGER